MTAAEPAAGLGLVLAWPACRNARDLGGMTTVDGARIRAGALIRTDCLSQLTPAGLAVVRAAGVSRIVDLRGDTEVSERPSPFAGDPGYRHLPFVDPAAEASRDRGAERSLADVYRGSVERNAGRIAVVFTAIAEAPAGAVAVHCAAGKDRTGIVVALALRLVGVPVADVVADYVISERNLVGAGETPLAERPPWQRSRPETLLALLEHLDQRDGGVASYLTRIGVTAVTLAALRARLVGPEAG